MSDRSEESRARDRERSRQKRAAFKARGLNSKGEPFKGQQKPSEEARKFVIHGIKKPIYERADREPTIPKRGETHEQRRARGAALRGTPLARDLEESVRKRVEAMNED
jgi:7-keto-8-aminopelargonate synthetase-like enzyme